MSAFRIYKFLGSLKAGWDHLVGSKAEFPLEHRIYNSFTLITAVAIAYNIPFNYFVGLYLTASLTVVLAFFIGYAYYLSRFAGKHSFSFTLAAITINIAFALNYFFNGGLKGPTMLLMALSYFPIIAVAPKRQYGIWTAINLSLVLGVVLAEYLFPQVVFGDYSNRESYFVDMLSTYLIMIILVLSCTSTMIRSYNTARTSAEKAAAELQMLNQEKNRLFSIVAHDLRAPLANVQSYLELLVKVNLPENKRLELKSDLMKATKSTLDMLTNVLSWSRSQMEGLEIRVEAVNVYELLTPTLDLFQNIAAGKEITLTNTLAQQDYVMADADMLQLIIRNLVNNAVKFTAKGGNICIRATQHQDALRIQVEDSGNGKPVILSPDVFELNGKQTAVGTNRERGVGLGLVLCRDFTEALKGKIWFETSPVSGTTFIVQLPLAYSKNISALPAHADVS
ncbi:sensor histidine kinase KdpD [Pontibacter sp. SGAir0037]|uniref:sensor histidine kinase n=1 Tax=Pontibacter sp. SGAir0037 TaxID=2571030 RepID=UPI0010CD158F|nr:HAMP domain-containing sensor histidine kinase [Pontibacter sp. SGAir0037]QCR22089.1 two-component sensor histidine kinase [Pontibacter sp. SGAir0037]